MFCLMTVKNSINGQRYLPLMEVKKQDKLPEVSGKWRFIGIPYLKM